MEFHHGLNLMLEALAYLGRRAGGYSCEWMLERLHSRGVKDLGQIKALLTPLSRITEELDAAVTIDPERLQYLFGSLPGFPYNTIGTYSRGFLLLYPLVSKYRGSCAEILEHARKRSAPILAGDLAMILDLGEEPELSGEELSARILSLNVPAESKVAVLELYHRGSDCLFEAMELVSQVVAWMESTLPRLELCCAPFIRQVQEVGPEAMLAQTSALNSDPHRGDELRPFLFGLDTLLAVQSSDSGMVQVCCGILRRELQEALASAKGPEVEVFEAIRLLADQTRFDILCYLRDHDAYGQELAAKFSLSRNTIHHHMTKLLSGHLVKCTVDGNRVYYRVDENTIRRLIERQQELLLPGAQAD